MAFGFITKSMVLRIQRARRWCCCMAVATQSRHRFAIYYRAWRGVGESLRSSSRAMGARLISRIGRSASSSRLTMYGRGLDILVGAYNFLDLAPKGRDEDHLDFTMDCFAATINIETANKIRIGE
jgi:predicted dithiol-disulfide oxidoreductase (DUF899 family)